MEFQLNEKEAQAAQDFIKEHNHRKDFEASGKLGFSTLGMQFTYKITPGGLGDLISIKCNACNEEKDITDIDSW